MELSLRSGSPATLGATPREDGTNFAVATSAADGVELCLFDEGGEEHRLLLRDYDGGVWHGFVPGVRAGARYGLRATGPYDPCRGVRCNPAKLLLDPYARATSGELRYGAELLGYDLDDPDRWSSLDSAGATLRSVVVDTAFHWSDHAARPRLDDADAVLYELHVKGFTMTHPGVPPRLRGTYAGLGHKAVIDYLVELGVTAVELLPVHQYVPEPFLVERGLTNYWGYNTICFFAPHRAYSAPRERACSAAR
jgi:isoamylase